MKAKNFILITLNDEINKARKEIRLIKKDIKVIENIKTVMRSKSEKEILETILQDKELKEAYETLTEKIKGRDKEEIQKMVRTGKLKEIQLDGKGKPIPETNSNTSGESEQLVNASDELDRGSSDRESRGDEPMLSDL